MKRLMLSVLLVALLVAPTFATGTAEPAAAAQEGYSWQPNKPINLIVPWGAGGSTDRSARTTAGILEEYLGTTVVVVNQPGASGSVGTKSVMDAPADGYTWTAGAVKDLGSYPVQGLLDTTMDDWVLFLNVAMPAVVSVNVDTPYQDFGQLLAAFKAAPGQVPVATAGVNSSGHTAMELIKRFTGIEYRHVTYDGGNPAVIATVGGETEVVPQLSVEQVDMLRANRLRPLAVLTAQPLRVAGYAQEIPAVTRWIPDFVAAPIYFGIFVPSDVPAEVIETLGQIWDEHMKSSPVLRTWAEDNAVVFDPAWGDEALEKAMPMVQIDAWMKFDSGDAVINPETVGIMRP
jgi:tripartite-type tricarboxylate transporter receptor subunit TctC